MLYRNQRPYITHEERMLLWPLCVSVSLFDIMMQKLHFHEIFLFETVRREKREMKLSMPVNTVLLDRATISSF